MSESAEWSGFYRAVALDFDGTLADGGPPSGEVLTAMADLRRVGVRIVLVTGRIIEELVEVWPEAMSAVDALVAENGAVMEVSGGRRILASVVDHRLDAALTDAGVAFRRGEVILAAKAGDEPAVVSAIRRLELGSQTVVNRAELMVLPAGVSKGAGLYQALGELELSFHNTIAVGDAENDESLLQTSELAVAVANAVESIKERADVVLTQPDGTGVASLLGGDMVWGRRVVHSPRWHIELGEADDGSAVSLPASQINLLIAGATGTGKSYLAGLVAEQLVGLGYSILVIDPEGDHVGLANRHGVLVMGGALRLPHPRELLCLLHHRYASVVADLSGLDASSAARYRDSLLTRVAAHRLAAGLPHWIFLDEADRSLNRWHLPPAVYDQTGKGYCLVTWRPGDLAASAVASLDAVVAMGSPQPDEATVDLAAAMADLPPTEVAERLASNAHRALVVRRDQPATATLLHLANRVTPHLRHVHKYNLKPLEPERRFHFRRNSNELTGARAGNLVELEDELARCERSTLAHHCVRHDFSRWVADVFRDNELAQRLALIESSVAESAPAATIEQSRLRLIHALQSRLPE